MGRSNYCDCDAEPKTSTKCIVEIVTGITILINLLHNIFFCNDDLIEGRLVIESFDQRWQGVRG